MRAAAAEIASVKSSAWALNAISVARGVSAGVMAASPRTAAAASRVPSAPPQSGEDHAFGEQLAHEVAAAGAQRGADGHLAAARGGARDQQAGHIGAGDQHDEAHRHHQHQQGRAYAAHHAVLQQVGVDAHGVVGRGILLLEALRDGVEVGAGGGQRDVGLQAGEDMEAGARSAIEELAAGLAERGEDLALEVRVGVAEAGRHHADDGVRLAIEIELSGPGLRASRGTCAARSRR